MTSKAISEATLQLTSRQGDVLGALTISCLADNDYWNDLPQLLDATEDAMSDPTAAPIQLLEDCEYRYSIDAVIPPVILQPSEVFNPDDETWLTGRLRPSRRTGTLLIDASVGEDRAFAEVEVRSRKLNYLSEYRWMLQRLADEATELLLQEFAASRLRALEPGDADPNTLYQKFAFISALLADEAFEGSLQQVLRRPHHSFERFEEFVHTSRGLRAGRSLSRELAGPGKRTSLPMGRTVGPLTDVPESVSRATHRETLDTVPNRFVLYALKSWRDLAESVLAALDDVDSAAASRGRREASQLAERMERLLSDAVFADVGSLERFPSGNQVLQRRDGYRDVYRAFLQAEVAAALTWRGGEDLFAAGQRDVATLYEYWTFLELARVIGELPGFDIDRKSLLATSKDDMSLQLRQGGATMLRGHGYRMGRRLELQLWFNRTFRKSAAGSWTEQVRPDCSLQITPSPALTGEASTWLHFDAKYRVGSYKEFFNPERNEDESEGTSTVLKPLSEDLLKMHAYRDAIRRTSGAYVLYPGGDETPPRHKQYHEILPGLGAFVMRPTERGVMDSSTEGSLRAFIDDVLSHVSAGGTSHERADFWTQKSYRDLGRQVPFEKILDKPAADTPVLLAFVKSDEHLAWIQENFLYNMRADDRRGSVGISSPELGVDFAVLYRPGWATPLLMACSGAFFIKDRQEMLNLGYPDPRGQSYVCLGLTAGSIETPVDLVSEAVLELARSGRPRDEWAAPSVTSWAELLGS